MLFCIATANLHIIINKQYKRLNKNYIGFKDLKALISVTFFDHRSFPDNRSLSEGNSKGGSDGRRNDCRNHSSDA